MPVKHELPYFATYQPTLTLERERGKYVSKPVRPVSQGDSPFQPKKISIVLIIIFSVFAFYLGAIFYFAFPFKFSHTIDRDLHDVRILYNLVDVQNKTINTLMARVKTLPYLQSFYEKKKSVSSDLTTMALHQAKRYDSMTKRERDCEMRYGLSLADEWRGTEETWCQSETNIPGKVSSLKCYPYQQQHRAEQGKGKDVFCVAENFVVDFSLIIGDAAPDGVKLFNAMAYLDVTMNTAFQATCKRTPAYSLDTFAPHTNKFFMNFRDGVEEPTFDVFEDTTTYFLPRDEDNENTFHSVADFVNMYLVKDILNYDVSEQQVLIMDKMPNNPYQELLERAFAPVHGVHRHGKYQKQRVMFKKLIFHLESPASLIFPETSTHGPQRCRDSTLFDAYRRHVLQSFNLLEVEPPPVPTASLILRHRTAWKNVGRVMANEDEVVTAFQKEGNMMRTNVLDLASMSYGEQLRVIRSSNILVGVHGAGLMWIMFAADEAVLMEIHPSYREDRHFRHIARLMGKDYMPMRSLTRETCQLTSDNVLVAIPEFRDTLSGAVRLARSYDQGTSECGLLCPPAILAMDARLSGYFDDPTIANHENTPHVKGLDETFPCPGV